LLENVSAFPSSTTAQIPATHFDHGQPLNWFAVYTNCRHEKRAAQHFQQREIAHYLPLFRSQRQGKNGARVAVDFPLFPGYIFVNITRDARVRVLQVPGVISIVSGLNGKPASISDGEIESLREGLRHRCARPHPYLATGQRVRIRSGPLTGIEGTIVRVKNGLRVVLTLDLIMQCFSVEVQHDELELLQPVIGVPEAVCC
jgi:transcription termination/antitermination protein NusG